MGRREVPGESEALSGGSTQGRNAPLPAPTGRPQGSPAPPSSHRELACFLLAHPFTQHQRRGRTLCVLLTFRNGAVVQEFFHQKEILPFVTTGANVEDTEVSQVQKDTCLVLQVSQTPGSGGPVAGGRWPWRARLQPAPGRRALAVSPAAFTAC